MNNKIKLEIELYPLENFKVILDHEIRKSRRYKYHLTLIHIAVEAEPNTPETQHGAEMVAINALDVELRDSDIPCKDGHEFLVLMPSTDEQGGRSACVRLEKVLNAFHQIHEGMPSFQAFAFLGISSTRRDSVLSAAKLMEEASLAMNHARTNHSQRTVLFSEIR